MIWSAFILGLMGSVHCLAMCGPLVLTVNARRKQKLIDRVYYNTGRISTYCTLGALAGLLGSGIEWSIGQQYLSIVSGVFLLFGLSIAWIESSKKISVAHRLLALIKIQIGKILNAKSSNMYLFGVYNGFLPCGLTYAALAAAVSTGSLIEAVVYMALFGLGTSPMMWTLVSGFHLLKPRWISGNRVVTTFSFIIAVLLIVRGLDLGVPYLSPDFSSHHATPVSICN